jgi:hypothetical protein
VVKTDEVKTNPSLAFHDKGKSALEFTTPVVSIYYNTIITSIKNAYMLAYPLSFKKQRKKK